MRIRASASARPVTTQWPLWLSASTILMLTKQLRHVTEKFRLELASSRFKLCNACFVCNQHALKALLAGSALTLGVAKLHDSPEGVTYTLLTSSKRRDRSDLYELRYD